MSVLEPKYGRPIKLLGEGTYAEVSLYKRKDGKKYAIKEMKYYHSGVIEYSSVREIAIMKRMNHPNILGIEEYMLSKNLKNVYLVTKFMEHGTLDDFIENAKPGIRACHLAYKRLVYQLVCGVAYMHSIDILHRDLKPENILLDENYNVKIADFGLSRALSCVKSTNKTVKIVTLYYKGPELLYGGRGDQYGKALDMWSVGCIIYEILTDAILFDGYSEEKVIDKITKIMGTPTEISWPGITAYPKYKVVARKKNTKTIKSNLMARLGDRPTLVDKWYNIITKILVMNPVKRASALEILSYPFFDEVRDKKLEPKYLGCLQNLYKVEVPIKKFVQPSFRLKQKLINWLVGVSDGFELSQRTTFIGIYLHDRMYSAIKLDKLNYQLYGSACLYLAEIYNEIYTSDIDEYVYILDNSFTSKKLVDMATDILKHLDFKMVFSTSYDFLVEYGRFYNDSIVKLATGLLYYTFALPPRYQEKPDQLALMCIMMACIYYGEIFKHTKELTNELIKKMGMCKDLILSQNTRNIDKMFATLYSKENIKDIMKKVYGKPLLV